MVMPHVIGGFGEKKSNSGTQWYQQDRVYGGGNIALCLPASIPGGSYKYALYYEMENIRDDEFVVCIDDTYGFDGVRYYVEKVPALRASRSGLKVTYIDNETHVSLGEEENHETNRDF